MQIDVKIVKLSKIKINPDNPRTISNNNMDKLVKSLQEFPDMLKLREIIVDDTMMIIGGNMRYLALKKAGILECTAKIVKGLTLQQKREFIIKDNASFGENDFDALANLWSDFPLAEWGVDIPKSWTGASSETGGDDLELEKPQIIVCPKCNHEFIYLEREKG